MNKQDFTDIDAAKWDRIKAAVKAKAGINIQADLGANGAKGIVMSWVYLPEAETLSVTLVRRSFFDPSEDIIDEDLKEMIESA